MHEFSCIFSSVFNLSSAHLLVQFNSFFVYWFRPLAVNRVKNPREFRISATANAQHRQSSATRLASPPRAARLLVWECVFSVLGEDDSGVSSAFHSRSASVPHTLGTGGVARPPAPRRMAAASAGSSADRQEVMKTVAAAISSGLSIIGALYILGRYWYARRAKTGALAAAAGVAPHHLDVTKELVHVLAWLVRFSDGRKRRWMGAWMANASDGVCHAWQDLVGALGRIFGTLPTRTFDQSAGERTSGICNLQAVVITFGDGAPIAWNLVMAFNLFRWVCMGEDQQMLQRRIKWYILGTLVLAFLPAFLALGCAFLVLHSY